MKPSIAGAIRIGSIKPVKIDTSQIHVEAAPLTQDILEQYWNECAEELNLQQLLSDASVSLGEHPGLIDIKAKTVSFHDEFKPHRIDVMEALRRRCGMPMLDCKVTPMYIKKEDVPYSPNEKYNAMLQTNPKLFELRKLFPQIDL